LVILKERLRPVRDIPNHFEVSILGKREGYFPLSIKKQVGFIHDDEPHIRLDKHFKSYGVPGYYGYTPEELIFAKDVLKFLGVRAKNIARITFLDKNNVVHCVDDFKMSSDYFGKEPELTMELCIPEIYYAFRLDGELLTSAMKTIDDYSVYEIGQ
jgi:hypothetical protein